MYNEIEPNGSWKAKMQKTKRTWLKSSYAIVNIRNAEKQLYVNDKKNYISVNFDNETSIMFYKDGVDYDEKSKSFVVRIKLETIDGAPKTYEIYNRTTKSNSLISPSELIKKLFKLDFIELSDENPLKKSIFDRAQTFNVID